jgi:hypothetical protein
LRTWRFDSLFKLDRPSNFVTSKELVIDAATSVADHVPISEVQKKLDNVEEVG